MERNINYYANLGVECHFLKIKCREYNFPKRKGVSMYLLKKKKNTIAPYLNAIKKITIKLN